VTVASHNVVLGQNLLDSMQSGRPIHHSSKRRSTTTGLQAMSYMLHGRQLRVLNLLIDQSEGATPISTMQTTEAQS
jgi:hypothetical protein